MFQLPIIVLAVAAAHSAIITSPSEMDSIRKLIEQLDANEFRNRDKASRDLDRYGVKALPLLKEAARSPKPEIADRATKLRVQIQRDLRDTESAAILADLGAAGLQDFVKKMAGVPEHSTPARWKASHRLSDYVQGVAHKEGPVEWLKGPVGNLDGKVIRDPQVAALNERVLFELTGRVDRILSCTVISKGTVHANMARDSILIVDGNVRSTGLNNCVVICNGHVRSISIENCVILCKGNLKTTIAENCFIDARNDAQATFGKGCVLFNTPNASGFAARDKNSCLEMEDPFQQIRFK